MVAVRRADRDADAPAAGRRRCHVLAMAHDCVVPPDPVVLPNRAQPSSERLRPDRRGRPGLPRPLGPRPNGERRGGRGAPREGLEYVLARQEPQRPGRRVGHGREQAQLAAGARLRPLLRLHRWRDQPVVSQPGRGQPLRRAAVPPRGGLPPVQGPGRQGDQRHPRQPAAEKPWFMWYCPGANHAPHHVPKEWADKYKGKFDDGYEAYREWALPRMIEKGILPEGTELTEMNPLPRDRVTDGDLVRPWDSLSDDEKRLFSRMAEVYAGFSEYTDYHVGRIIDYLEESGQLENTLIFYCADNGASGEGSPNGSVNENKFFNAWPDDIEQNLAMLDQLGSPDTYNHYPTGWAMAFSTPFRMFKRFCYQGGVADPLVIHWPKGIDARGGVRHQYHHATDIVPTILD